MLLPAKGLAIDLGNGNFTTDNVNFRGRPVAKWIALYGDKAKPEIDAIRQELVARLGEARAARVADTNRNLVIFPNLVINDGSSVTVRTFFPTPDDVEALELVQQGLANWQDIPWSEMSRGMGKDSDQLNSDEHHLRIFWRHWSRLMESA